MSQPVQYQQGTADFFGYQFISDARALIPRFETEFLVSRAVEFCQTQPDKDWKIVDVGTGSGVVAVSAVLKLPKAQVTAIDISADALALARENAIRHGVADRINFTQGDLLKEFIEKGESADIILANLPYIPTQRIATLDDSVRDHEPHTALDGGSDGMDLYRSLFGQIASMPTKPKLCVFEFDDGQEGIATAELAKTLPEAKVSILKDSSDLIRYIVLEFK